MLLETLLQNISEDETQGQFDARTRKGKRKKIDLEFEWEMVNEDTIRLKRINKTEGTMSYYGQTFSVQDFGKLARATNNFYYRNIKPKLVVNEATQPVQIQTKQGKKVSKALETDLRGSIGVRQQYTDDSDLTYTQKLDIIQKYEIASAISELKNDATILQSFFKKHNVIDRTLKRWIKEIDTILASSDMAKYQTRRVLNKVK